MAPVAEAPVLHHEPERRVGDACRALRRRASPARRPTRRGGRVSPSSEKPRDGFGSIRPDPRAAAHEEGAEPQQLFKVLEHVVLVGTSETRALENVQQLSVFRSYILENRLLLVIFQPSPDVLFRVFAGNGWRAGVSTGHEKHAQKTRSIKRAIRDGGACRAVF